MWAMGLANFAGDFFCNTGPVAGGVIGAEDIFSSRLASAKAAAAWEAFHAAG